MKQKLLCLLAGAGVLLTLGCEGGALTRPGVTPSGETGSAAASAPAATGEVAVVEVRFDETVSSGALRLRWMDLNDSRCPQGVKCVWAGEAAATVEVTRNGLEPQTIVLKLRAGQEESAQMAAGSELRLLDVEPYPRTGMTPERGDYVAAIGIRSL